MAIDAEVCIVGAGPAGSLVAAELVRREIPTVLIEAGPRHDPSRRAEYARQLLAGVDVVLEQRLAGARRDEGAGEPGHAAAVVRARDAPAGILRSVGHVRAGDERRSERPERKHRAGRAEQRTAS